MCKVCTESGSDMCEVCAKVHSRLLHFGGEFGFSASPGNSASRLRPGIRLLGFAREFGCSASRLLGFAREFGFSASRLPPPSAGPLYHRYAQKDGLTCGAWCEGSEQTGCQRLHASGILRVRIWKGFSSFVQAKASTSLGWGPL